MKCNLLHAVERDSYDVKKVHCMQEKKVDEPDYMRVEQEHVLNE